MMQVHNRKAIGKTPAKTPAETRELSLRPRYLLAGSAARCNGRAWWRRNGPLAGAPAIPDLGSALFDWISASRRFSMIYELDGIRPELPEEGGYWVAPTAALIGKVRLKRDASVWFGAVLRGDNEWIELGERSQIQDNATLHTDPGFPMTIGPDCVIGHNVILHGCTIGANSLIGMGAILLNGSRIGDNCLVGAGALITEGKSFPERSLIVGAPARAVRTLDDAAIKGIAAAADIYVRRFKQYAKGLKPIG
jgi:carbonic anhydrase/acetyltransferase-like protein (isoleucine patch superfamily)